MSFNGDTFSHRSNIRTVHTGLKQFALYSTLQHCTMFSPLLTLKQWPQTSTRGCIQQGDVHNQKFHRSKCYKKYMVQMCNAKKGAADACSTGSFTPKLYAVCMQQPSAKLQSTAVTMCPLSTVMSCRGMHLKAATEKRLHTSFHT